MPMADASVLASFRCCWPKAQPVLAALDGHVEGDAEPAARLGGGQPGRGIWRRKAPGVMVVWPLTPKNSSRTGPVALTISLGSNNAKEKCCYSSTFLSR